MLLIDLSGVITHTCVNLHQESREEVSIDVVRHVALSTVLYYKKKFSKTYGKPVICVDRKPYWREYIHEFYKKNRKQARDESEIDWVAFSANFKLVQQDIDNYLPYPFIDIASAEADDGIGVLTQYAAARKEKVMIVSSDKDMIQLQDKYQGVKQYSPRMKKLLVSADKDYDLLTHIIKGDRSDGIPNIYSANDILMFPGTGLRQKVVTKKMLAAVNESASPLEFYKDEELYKFKRNRMLIDLDYIPDRIRDRIIERYEAELAKNRKNRVMACVKKYRLRNLLSSVKDF